MMAAGYSMDNSLMFMMVMNVGAFVGLIVGAGFASGQEIIQFFTSFGMMGMKSGSLPCFRRS